MIEREYPYVDEHEFNCAYILEKERSRMTCFDKYISEQELPVRGCPADYGYMKERPVDCYSISCFKDCWAREASVNDDKKARKSE